MRIALIILASLVGIALLITVVGLFMPREHVATSEITLKQPIDSVYATLRDLGGMTKWWSDLKVSERVPGAAGERWRQEAAGFRMQLDIVDDAPPKGFTTNIVPEKGAPFGGTWIYALSTSPAGTVVSITEKGWIGPPPFRVIAHVTGLNRTLDGLLRALGKRFGETVTPIHRLAK
jgi:hypothetical protein